jgi:hypothetical protein
VKIGDTTLISLSLLLYRTYAEAVELNDVAPIPSTCSSALYDPTLLYMIET